MAKSTTDTSLLGILSLLWDLYIEYLWNYESDSWVARIAYSCRVLAVVAALPLVILALLDISSYVIARTLGVIDDTKASTSDRASIHLLPHENPTIEVEAASPIAREKRTLNPNLPSLDTSAPHAFFTSTDGDKLSGVGEFSPAASRPPSPTLSRKQLPGFNDSRSGDDAPILEEDGLFVRRRAAARRGSGTE